MTTSEILSKLKVVFNEMMNPTIQSVQLISATLQDGTAVEVTALEVGGIVTINGTPAPAGEHILSDGTVIVVGENGAITEIKPAMPEEPAMQEDMKKKMKMEEMFEAFQSSTEEKFKAYESKFAEYENKLNNAYKVIDVLNQLTQKLAETPTGTPDVSVKQVNTFSAQQDLMEKYKSYEGFFTK